MFLFITIIICLLVGILTIVRFLFNISIIAINEWKLISKTNSSLEKQKKKRSDMIKSGEKHEWVKVAIGTKELLVCKKTLWCPALNSFINKTYFDQYNQSIKRQKDYKVFRDKRVVELAEEYDMTVEKMEVLVEAIFSIKKDYYVQFIDSMVKEASQLLSEKKDAQS